MRMASPVRNGILGAASIIVAAVLTIEFFIYLHQRILAFMEAIAGIPKIFVFLFFGSLVYATWLVLGLFMEVKLEDIIMKFRNSWDKVKEVGKGGLFNAREWWQNRRLKKKATDMARKESKGQAEGPLE